MRVLAVQEVNEAGELVTGESLSTLDVLKDGHRYTCYPPLESVRF